MNDAQAGAKSGANEAAAAADGTTASDAAAHDFSGFEEALQQLEQTVQRLEHDNLTLQEAMDLFAQGVKLAAYCAAQLDVAEQTLQKLTDGPDGLRLVPAPELETAADVDVPAREGASGAVGTQLGIDIEDRTDDGDA